MVARYSEVGRFHHCNVKVLCGKIIEERDSNGVLERQKQGNGNLLPGLNFCLITGLLTHNLLRQNLNYKRKSETRESKSLINCC